MLSAFTRSGKNMSIVSLLRSRATMIYVTVWSLKIWWLQHVEQLDHFVAMILAMEPSSRCRPRDSDMPSFINPTRLVGAWRDKTKCSATSRQEHPLVCVCTGLQLFYFCGEDSGYIDHAVMLIVSYTIPRVYNVTEDSLKLRKKFALFHLDVQQSCKK